MITFIYTLTITFSLLLITMVLLSYCKRRQNRTSHGLTGMCHETGGTMCGCCSSQLLSQSRQTGQTVHCTPSTNNVKPMPLEKTQFITPLKGIKNKTSEVTKFK